eukprot:2601002-Pleurochrysis_carterae.AAC.1
MAGQVPALCFAPAEVQLDPLPLLPEFDQSVYDANRRGSKLTAVLKAEPMRLHTSARASCELSRQASVLCASAAIALPAPGARAARAGDESALRSFWRRHKRFHYSGRSGIVTIRHLGLAAHGAARATTRGRAGMAAAG